MATRSIAQLKSWFRKGLYPTEQQFADLIDSFRHKNEPVEVADVPDIADAINKKYDKSEAKILTERVDALDGAVDLISKKLENLNDLIHELDERLTDLESYNRLKILTPAQFAALAEKDDNVLYVVNDDTAAANLALDHDDALPDDEVDSAYSYMDAMGAVMEPGDFTVQEQTDADMIGDIADEYLLTDNSGEIDSAEDVVEVIETAPETTEDSAPEMEKADRINTDNIEDNGNNI